MKKFFLTLALAAVATSAFAQIEGLSAGAGYLTNTLKSTYTSGSSSTTHSYDFGGFYAGVNYTLLEIGPGIAITPGLQFASVTYKEDNTTWGESYLAVPVNFSYKLDLVPGTLAIQPYAGPTFAFGLGSKNTYTIGSVSTTSDMYGDDSDYGKFDLLVGAGIALDIVDMIRVTIGYDLGLLDRDSSDNGKIKSSNLNFGVAYLF